MNILILLYGFYWLLSARSGYRLDARIAKAVRGLFLGYHVSCQAVLEDNSYTYLVSLTI